MIKGLLKIGIILAAGGALWIPAAVLAADQEKEKSLYTGQNKRDPFVSLITPAGYLVNLETDKNATLRLGGIMYDPKGDSIAIINGELMRVGESIGDSVVASIEPAKVTVIQGNQKIELELRREE
jgi:hypothetical protein